MSRSYFLYLSQGNKKALNKYLNDYPQTQHDATSMVVSALHIGSLDMAFFLLNHKCVPYPDFYHIINSFSDEKNSHMLKSLIQNDYIIYDEDLKEKLLGKVKTTYHKGLFEYQEIIQWLEAHKLYKSVSKACEDKPAILRKKI